MYDPKHVPEVRQIGRGKCRYIVTSCAMKVPDNDVGARI